MTNKLRSMIVSVGVFVLGGVAFIVATPQPATRTMAELRDAGILDGQRLVIECPEKLTPQTKRRINANQPGLLRPKQAYAHVARTARCFGSLYLDGGVGNCLNNATGAPLPVIEERLQHRYSLPDGGQAWMTDDEALGTGGSLDVRSDGGLFERVGDYPRERELVIPSLRRNLDGVDLDAGLTDDGDDVDDSLQYANTACSPYTCPQYDEMVDAGTRANPFANAFCGALNRVMLVPAPGMLPNCFVLPDGGWDDNAGEPGHSPAPDCRGIGPYGEMDGGPRWRGCNVTPREFAVGAACYPVEMSVIAGDVPHQWL
jgi:hypothetical protein